MAAMSVIPPLLLLLVATSLALPDVVRIGGLFDSADPTQEIAFRYAAERVNGNGNILPRSKLTTTSERLTPNDSFAASKKVCHLLRNGVAAIFGPASEFSSSHVQSVCEATKVPNIQYRWDPSAIGGSSPPLSINLFPHAAALSRAYWDVVRGYGWKSFTILYEDEDGLARLHDLLTASTKGNYKVIIRPLSEGDDQRPLLKEMKKMSERNIVLDCKVERVASVLEQAQQVGLMSLAHSYLITSLDIHLVNFDKFKYTGANITGVQLVDMANTETANIVANWVYGEMRYGKNLDLTEKTLRVETALIYDSVLLLAKALHELDRSQVVNIKSISCEGIDSWTHGQSLVNYMKLIEIEGLTGTIKFDGEGLRSYFHLNVVEMTTDGIQAVGTWNPTDGANFTRMWLGLNNRDGDSLFNKTLIVSTILSNPYFMMKESNELLSGNDRFEGFVFDIIDEISKMLGFHFKFKLVDDSSYGSLDKETGEWNGMIRELLDGKADLALGDLSISFDREKAVDFTMPFLNTGISILYKKPQKQPPNLFSFLSPLSVEVWIYMCTAFLGVSFALFMLSRLTPYEWNSPHPCKQQPDVLFNQFGILNSMWFNIGSLMQQGSDIMPKATSTRMVAGIWWFFTLIMISSYTANLAAFLTVGLMDSPIKSAEDLAKQTKIKYGSVGSGSTFSFFRDSTIPTYQRMWQFMESTRPSVFTKSTMEGVERVQRSNGQYAFMMEMSSIEYFTERKCDLTQVGGLIDSKGYGIAMRPGSPYRAALSQAVLKMQETNRLLILKNKWWKERRGGGQCKSEGSKDSAAAAELGLANVGGMFVVLVAGCTVATLIALCEFAWKSRKLALHDDGGVWREMRRELYAAICMGNTKPVRRIN